MVPRFPPPCSEESPTDPHTDEQPYRTEERLWFGTRYLSASGTYVDRVHTNVRRLHVQHGVLVGFLLWFCSLLPQTLKDWARARFPEWFLPSVVILKKQKEGWSEEFANEKAMYTKLCHLADTVVPKCYGQATCADRTTALVLSDIGGTVLDDPAAAGIPDDVLRRLLGEAFDAMGVYGITHDDTKLDNFHLVGGRIMVVDLEMAEEDKPDSIRFRNEESIQHLLRAYKGHQEYLEFDSLLSPDLPKAHDF